MKDIGARLREVRIEKGLTQNELAEKLQCGAKAISRYENDENLEKVYDFIKICECLGELNYIITGKEYNNGKEISVQDQQILSAYHNLTDSDRRVVDFIFGIGECDIKNNLVETEPTVIYRFPVYEQKAAAGVGQLGRDSNYNMEEFVSDEIPNEAAFAMRIFGDSMKSDDTNNLIHTDSLVLINPKFLDSELDNKIVIANFKGEIICKRYIDKRDYILFQSDNKDFEEENRKSSDDMECKIIGIVLGVIDNDRYIRIK